MGLLRFAHNDTIQMGKFQISNIIFFCSFLTSNLSFAQTETQVNIDTSKIFVVKQIVLVGNKRTVDGILYRELTFHTGDSLTEKQLNFAFQRSTENLLN